MPTLSTLYLIAGSAIDTMLSFMYQNDIKDLASVVDASDNTRTSVYADGANMDFDFDFNPDEDTDMPILNDNRD